jgi:hypothetical protein
MLSLPGMNEADSLKFLEIDHQKSSWMRGYKFGLLEVALLTAATVDMLSDRTSRCLPYHK